MNDLLRQIQKVSKTLPHAQRLVSEYVLINYSEIPFLTITNMAQEIGVSDTTIIKFCSILGYDSFSGFKKKFVQHVKTELAIYNNFESRIGNMNDKDTLDQILENDNLNIKTTLTRLINKQNLEPFLDMLDSASNIYICGMRSSSILMDFLTQSLRVQGYSVIPFISNGHFIDQLCQAKPTDLFISFAFSRYTAKSVKALEFISKKKIPCVAFTDSTLSPTYGLADLSFICETQSFSYQASYVGVLSLLNAIITKTSLRNKNKASQSLKELEDALEHFDMFTQHNE
jgi:DNA-binding MurR/RpiR family transcriptional regulator